VVRWQWTYKTSDGLWHVTPYFCTWKEIAERLVGYSYTKLEWTRTEFSE